MEKLVYERPMMRAEAFAANNYIAGCARGDWGDTTPDYDSNNTHKYWNVFWTENGEAKSAQFWETDSHGWLGIIPYTYWVNDPDKRGTSSGDYYLRFNDNSASLYKESASSSTDNKLDLGFNVWIRTDEQISDFTFRSKTQS